MPIASFDPDSVWKLFGAFSQVVLQGAGEIVHLRDQVSLDKDGGIVGERDIYAQIKKAVHGEFILHVAIGVWKSPLQCERHD